MKVVNCRKEKYDIYIGRPSVFGNPFLIGKHGDREEVIRKYEAYALENKELLKAIYSLSDSAVLGCYCKPLACHGDIIVKLYNQEKGV